MFPLLTNLVLGCICILEIETSGFTDDWLWKGEGKEGMKNE